MEDFERAQFGFVLAWTTIVVSWAVALVRQPIHMFWLHKLGLLLLGFSLGVTIIEVDDVLGWALLSGFLRQPSGSALAFSGLFAYVLPLIELSPDDYPTLGLTLAVVGIGLVFLGYAFTRAMTSLEARLPRGIRRRRPAPFDEPISYLF